jgi:hypothetical protein
LHCSAFARFFDMIADKRASKSARCCADKRAIAALSMDLVTDYRAGAGAQCAAHKGALLDRSRLTAHQRHKQRRAYNQHR